jgi:hypothetical protein
MIGTTTQRQTLEIERPRQESVSLDEVLRTGADEPKEETTRFLPVALPGVMLGTLDRIDPCGRPLVVFSGSAPPTAARSTVVLDEKDIGREVVLMFEGGDSTKPIIVGVVQEPGASPRVSQRRDHVEARVDGHRVVLDAEQEIVLRCGKASITLTRAGKVLIRGAYLLSRSSGVNRIKGGSVQIN